MAYSQEKPEFVCVCGEGAGKCAEAGTIVDLGPLCRPSGVLVVFVVAFIQTNLRLNLLFRENKGLASALRARLCGELRRLF